jgi:hypothetical protein
MHVRVLHGRKGQFLVPLYLEKLFLMELMEVIGFLYLSVCPFTYELAASGRFTALVLCCCC